MRDREESAALETGTLWNILSCLFKKLEFSKWSAGFYIENRFSEAVSMHCQVWLFFFFLTNITIKPCGRGGILSVC